MIDEMLNTFGLSRTTKPRFVLPASRDTVEVTSKAIRVNPVELEKSYLRHPIVFNGVNAYNNVFLSTEYYLSGDKDDVDDLTSFLDKIDWQTKIVNIVSRQAIYGKAWLELMEGESSKKLVDVVTIDPKTMDFRRDMYGNIVYDRERSGPSGYFQYLSYESTSSLGLDTVMQRSPWEDGETRGIEVPKEKIVMYPLYTSSNDVDGVGVIEPSYDVIKSSNTFRKGLAQYIVRHGFPITVTYVGDANHEPTMEEIDHVAGLMLNVNEKTEHVVPYFYRIDVLESKKSIQLSQHLEYFDDLIIAGMGVPRAFVLGAGEGLNKSTLDKQNLMFMRKIKMMQHTISQITYEKIFKRYAEENGFNTIPRMVWEEVSLDDMDSKAQRISQYVQVAALTPDDGLESFIRNLEHVPKLVGKRAVPKEVNGDEKVDEDSKLKKSNLELMRQETELKLVQSEINRLRIKKDEEEKVILEEENRKLRRKREKLLDKVLSEDE